MSNSVALSTFTMLYNHHLYVVPKHFHFPKSEPISIEQLFSFSHLHSPWQPPICFLSLWIDVFEILHIKRIIALCDLLYLASFFFFLLAPLIIIYLFIYFWLCWVFVSVRGLSLVVASRGHSSSRCAGLSLSWPLLLQSTGSRRAGSAVVAHGPSCSAACGIFPDRGSNPCPLH